MPDAPSTEQAAPVPGGVIDADRIFLTGVLMNLDVGYWSGEVKLSPEDLDKRPQDIPSFVRLGHKELVEKDDLCDIRTIAGRARALLKLFSFKYPGLADLRFVPKSVWIDVCKKLGELETEFWAAVEIFVTNYPDIRDKFLLKHEDHRAILEPCYPAAGAIRKCFKFRYTSKEFALPKEVKAAAYTKEKAEEEIKVLSKIKEDAEKERDEFLKGVVAHLRAQTIEVFKSVKDRLDGGKNVTKQQVEKMQGFIENFEQLNFMGDGEMAAQIAEIKGELAQASQMTDEEFQKKLSASVSDIIQTAEKTEDIDDVTDNFKRNLLTIKEVKEDESSQ